MPKIPVPDVSYIEVPYLDADTKAVLGLFDAHVDAHVDAYWFDVDCDLQDWLDSDLPAPLPPQVMANIHDAANAWRTVR